MTAPTPGDGEDVRPIPEFPGPEKVAVYVRAALDRLRRIEQVHQQDVDEHGGTWGWCRECDREWPCPTREWARPDSTRTMLDCWDPDDDEQVDGPS